MWYFSRFYNCVVSYSHLWPSVVAAEWRVVKVTAEWRCVVMVTGVACRRRPWASPWAWGGVSSEPLILIGYPTTLPLPDSTGIIFVCFFIVNLFWFILLLFIKDRGLHAPSGFCLFSFSLYGLFICLFSFGLLDGSAPYTLTILDIKRKNRTITIVFSVDLLTYTYFTLDQAWAKAGPGAVCSPRPDSIRPTESCSDHIKNLW